MLKTKRNLIINITSKGNIIDRNNDNNLTCTAKLSRGGLSETISVQPVLKFDGTYIYIYIYRERERERERERILVTCKVTAIGDSS